MPTTGVLLPGNEGWSLSAEDLGVSKPGQMKETNGHQKSAEEAGELHKQLWEFEEDLHYSSLRGFYDQRETGS